MLAAKDADLVKPWDDKGYKMPGGAPYHPAGFMTFVGANAMILGKTMGVYPAAKALLAAVYEGALVPFDTALKIEARQFTSVLMNPSSTAMIRSLFINKEALDKGANRPDAPDQTVKKLGVLGAGMMGAGIAYVAANAGIEVVLIDSTQEAADQGRAHSEGLLDKGIARRKVTAEKKAEVLARITATTDYAALNGVDLIVEAVFEDPKVKAEVTEKGRSRGRRRAASLPPTPRPCRSRALATGQRAARTVHRHPLLLAGRQDDAGRDHQGPRRPARAPSPRRWISSAPSARRRSW